MFTLPVITSAPTFSDAKTSASSWLFEAKLAAVSLRDSLLSVPTKWKIFTKTWQVVTTGSYILAISGGILASTVAGILIFLAVMNMGAPTGLALFIQMFSSFMICTCFGVAIEVMAPRCEKWVRDTLTTLMFAGV